MFSAASASVRATQIGPICGEADVEVEGGQHTRGKLARLDPPAAQRRLWPAINAASRSARPKTEWDQRRRGHNSRGSKMG